MPAHSHFSEFSPPFAGFATRLPQRCTANPRLMPNGELCPNRVRRTRMSSGRAGLRRSILVSICLAAFGCSSTTAPAFGAHYLLLLEPDPPALVSSSLTVTVSYGGCASGRAFEVGHRARSNGSVEVWLRKTTPDEPCDMLVTEQRTFTVPGAVSNAATVSLLSPNESAYRLRP